MIVARKLTPKQMLFCDEYLADANMNATQAAIRAGYAKKRASEQAYQLLQKTTVQEYIEKRKADRVVRTEITQDKVLKELAIIAFANAADYAKIVEREATITREDGDEITLLDDDGNPVKVQTVEYTLTDQLTEDQKRAIAMIKNGRNGIEVQLYDKLQALVQIGKHIGMFKDKLEVSGEVNNPMAGLTTEELKKLADGL